MKVYGLDIKGETLVERLSTKPVWSSAYEGRLIYTQDNDELYFGISSDWRRISDIPSGETILFEKDTVVLGYTLQTDIDDQLVYISKGYANGGQKGGTAYDGSTWTQPSHSHTVNAHSHVVTDHSHTVNSHSHTVDAHSHSMQNHTHTGPSHTHTGPSHTHTGPSHLHQIYHHYLGIEHNYIYNSVGALEQVQRISRIVTYHIYDYDFYITTKHPQEMFSTYASGNTGAGGTQATGAGGTQATGIPSIANTGTGGTEVSGIPSSTNTDTTALTSNITSAETDTVAGSSATASPETDEITTISSWRPAGRISTIQQRI